MLHKKNKHYFLKTVDASRPRDPCCCQVDACYQPRRSSGSKDQAIALFLGSLAYLLLCVKTLLYNVRSSAPLFNGGKTFWLVMMSSRWWQSHHHPAGGCQRSWEVTCHRSCPFALQAAERGLWQAVEDDSARLARYSQWSGQ